MWGGGWAEEQWAEEEDPNYVQFGEDEEASGGGMDDSGVFMGQDGAAMDHYGGPPMGGMGWGPQGPGIMQAMQGMQGMGGMGGMRGAMGRGRGAERFAPLAEREGGMGGMEGGMRFQGFRGAPGGPRGFMRGGRGPGAFMPRGMMGPPRPMGPPRYGFGQMGGMMGRPGGGVRGARGNRGGFHEESYESFMARKQGLASPASPAFTIGSAGGEEFKQAFVQVGAGRGWAANGTGWGKVARQHVRPVRRARAGGGWWMVDDGMTASDGAPMQELDQAVVKRVLNHHLQVALPTGETATGVGDNKKVAKANAARGEIKSGSRLTLF
jgi:hypothetical protein